MSYRLRSVDPIDRPEDLYRMIWEYLKPTSDRPAPRTHLFTINGLTSTRLVQKVVNSVISGGELIL